MQLTARRLEEAGIDEAMPMGRPVQSIAGPIVAKPIDPVANPFIPVNQPRAAERPCSVCGDPRSRFGFGPPITRAGVQLWACSGHRSEVEQTIRAGHRNPIEQNESKRLL